MDESSAYYQGKINSENNNTDNIYRYALKFRYPPNMTNVKCKLWHKLIDNYQIIISTAKFWTVENVLCSRVS